MTTPSIMVPPLTLWNSDGQIDCGATAAYAQRAAESWIDLFMLSGSIGEGKTSLSKARRRTLEVWLDHVPTGRLLSCVWSPEDYDYLRDLGVRPVVVLQDLEDVDALQKLLADIPTGSFIYSHPDYSSITLTPSIAKQAALAGTLPAGAKISKISLEDIREIRIALGNDHFSLFDGRSRHIESSIQAGATGVVVVPLCLIPNDLPDRSELAKLQAMIDKIQASVDAETGISAQAKMLTQILRASL